MKSSELQETSLLPADCAFQTYGSRKSLEVELEQHFFSKTAKEISENSTSNSEDVSEKDLNQFEPSPCRYIVAILICLSSAFNCFIQYSFVSIWRIATETYDVDVLAVNMLALVFALFYIPGSIFAIALYAQYGLNSCIMWAAFFNMFACLFRYSSCLMPSRHTAYSAILVGHMFAAFGSPLVVNAPSRVANDWFPPRERAVAISIMTQANYLGGGLGGLIPTLQVVGSSGIVPMLLSQAILAGVIMLLSIVFTPSHSPVHADFDAAYQVELRSDVDVTNAMSIYNQMLRDFLRMLSNRQFVMLLLSLSIQVGLSWALGSVIGQLMQPCGYSDSLVGQTLMITTSSGVLGSFCLAMFLRLYHREYFTVYKVLMALTCFGTFLVFGFNQPSNTVLVLFSWTVYGFFSSPLSSIALELAAEMTYPIPADNSAALLFTVATGVYFICTVFLTPLLLRPESMSCSVTLTHASIFVCVLSFVGILVALPVTATFNRAEISAKERALRKIPSFTSF